MGLGLSDSAPGEWKYGNNEKDSQTRSDLDGASRFNFFLLIFDDGGRYFAYYGGGEINCIAMSLSLSPANPDHLFSPK